MTNIISRIVLVVLLFGLIFVAKRETAAADDAYQTGDTSDRRFGVVEGYEDADAASELGVGWSRVRFHWAEVQASGPGTWTPMVSDAQIGGEIADGRLVVGLLIGIPDWARGVNRLPRGLWLAHDDPRNTWARFVREAVGRYNGRINHWIIWNEPDIDDAAAPGHTWDGRIEDFVQLQRVAYLVAKETNPNTVIHLAALTHFWDPAYPGRLLDLIAADPAAVANNHYFDVATAHLYFQPDSIYTIIQRFSGDLNERGLMKPIWLVETNAPPINDPAWPVRNWTLAVTVDEQAAFIPQALASALAAGAERVAIYKLKDTADDRAANPEPFGLLRQNGRRRPAYTTYQVAIRYLSGATATTRERWDEVGQIRLDRGGLSTTVLFARLPIAQQARVRATADSGALIDMWGKRRPITAENGFFTIDLPPALCTQSIGDYCMIGGTTYYVVQAITKIPTADSRQPTAVLIPTPTTIPTVAPASPTPGLPTPVITLTEIVVSSEEQGNSGEYTGGAEEQGSGDGYIAGAGESGQFSLATRHSPLATRHSLVSQSPSLQSPISTSPASEQVEGKGILAYLFWGAAVLLAVGLGSWWLISGGRG